MERIRASTALCRISGHNYRPRPAASYAAASLPAGSSLIRAREPMAKAGELLTRSMRTRPRADAPLSVLGVT